MMTETEIPMSVESLLREVLSFPKLAKVELGGFVMSEIRGRLCTFSLNCNTWGLIWAPFAVITGVSAGIGVGDWQPGSASVRMSVGPILAEGCTVHDESLR